MSDNKISDINILENVKFEELQSLDLSNNQIVDINVFLKVKFYQLEELNLLNNKIDENKCLITINMLKSKIHYFDV